jgi:alkylation response protein AidB-like acyl-CoA dehydrogenase
MSGRLAAVLERVDKVAPTIVEHADESERLGCLAPAVIDALQDADLFRLVVPVELGGHGLTIPEATAVFERVAQLDASTGWVLVILAGGPLFARRIDPDAFADICSDPYGVICGTLNPATARAERVDGGYVFGGTATYLSGSQHAKWVMATAIVFDGDAPEVVDGFFHVRSGIFPIELARDLDTWHVTGMRATGSSEYAFENVHVEEARTFAPLQPRPSADHDDVFAHIPLWAQLGSGLAAVAVGTARNMIDRFVELATVKVPTGGNFARLAERGHAQIALGEAHGLYQAARAVLFDAVGTAWERGLAREPFDNQVLAEHRTATVTAVHLAARAIDLLHDVAGMNAIAEGSVIDRCWRDVHTMTQHLILSVPRYEIVGRVLLGLDPQSPVI